MEFVGRIDQQVKIRGFRVELGEIERYLSLVPGVGSVVVQPWEKGGDRGLCAYVTVAADAVAPEPGELKDYLAQWLPAYMIPTDFIRLEHIPLTPNGKVDRRALPSPSPVPRLHQSPVPRLHKTLNKFVQLWSEILGSPVGPDDDFFRLGGHSLKAALLAVRLQQEFNLRVSPADIFRYPTVRQLAAARGGTKFSGTDDIRSTEDKEYYPLSYQQQQLLDQGHRHPGSSADHVFGRITLPYPADRPTIVAVLEQLIIRHTLFRAYFGEIAGSPVQFIQDTGQVKELTRRAMQKTEHITEPITGPDSGHALCRREVHRSFDLSRAPLLRVVPVTTRVTSTGGVSNHELIHELIFTLHHIICDGWSMDILRRDFLALYEGQHRGEAVELGSPSLEYRDFAAWQNQALENPGVREKALSYWRRQLEGGFAPPPLPVLPVPPADDVIYRGMVDRATREKLQKVATEHGTTLFMVMYAAFQLLLDRVYGVHDVVCRFADAGRPFAPFHSVVGCFRVPVLTKIPVKKDEAFGRLLRRTAALTAEAIENQYYPYERIFRDLSLPVPEPTVGFNMLNMWQEETGVPTPSPVPQFSQFSPVPQLAQLTQLAEPVTDVKFPLYLQLIPLPQGIETTWMAVKRHFSDATLRDLAHRYLELLQEI